MKHIVLASLASGIFFSACAMDAPIELYKTYEQPVKSLYKQALKKSFLNCITEQQTIKKTNLNGTFGLQALFSPDGKYFIENVSTKNEKGHINLWHTSDRKIIKTFESYANGWIFDPHSNYVIFYIKNRHARHCPPAHIYFLLKEKEVSLYNERTILGHENLAISSNGNYIWYRFVKETGEETTLFLNYNHNDNDLNTIPHENWDKNDMSSLWTFGSDAPNHYADQHIIYLSKNNELIKRGLNNDCLIVHPLIEECEKIEVNESLITLKYRDRIELLEIKNDTIIPLRTIPYTWYNIKIIPIKNKKIIAHQSDKSSFIILDEQYNEIESYTFKSDTYSETVLEDLIINETGNNLIVLYNYNKEETPSNIAFLDISAVNKGMPTIHKNFNEKIHSIQFITHDLLLISGINAYIFDVKGNKIANLGECQSAIASGNSIIQIHHTPFYAYNSKRCGCSTVPMKTKVWLTTFNEEYLSQFYKKLNNISS